MIPRGLNSQALIIEDAQNELRKIVLNGFLNGLSFIKILAVAEKEIEKAIKQIKIATLRQDTRHSLIIFTRRQYVTLNNGIAIDPVILNALLLIRDVKASKTDKARAKTLIKYETDRVGLPADSYAEKIYKERIKPTLDRLVKQTALDPNDFSGRNSLRNLAEMEVRYDLHLEQIDSLKSKGVKLVVCSVHADCSDRCYKWQGRVYSLDKSYGTTSDGKSYEPLENATDIYYTTKAGRSYKNGLLGFNCRHTLYEYVDGMIIPSVSSAKQKEEYEITKRQRQLERLVRSWDVRAEMFKNIDRDEYLKSKRKADYWEAIYKEFSRSNSRAFYPSRMSV